MSRAMIAKTTDGRRVWTTVGVGQNIIEASWEALSEAYLFGLLHSDVSPKGRVADLADARKIAVGG